MKKDKWVVHIMGEPDWNDLATNFDKYCKTPENLSFTNELGDIDDMTFEISVLLKSNEHGQESYGWGGDDKIILFGDDHAIGGYENVHEAKKYFSKLKHIAHGVADILNNEQIRLE